MQERIERSKKLLATIHNAAMATVNKDGSPHNTPYFFMYSPDMNYLYWSSHSDSLHSQNIDRTGQIFVVLYEADKGGGLYIRADEAHATGSDELAEALKIHNSFRAKNGKDPLPLSYYQDGPQHMYKATVRQFWVNAAERNEVGNVIRDVRYEISPEDLLA